MQNQDKNPTTKRGVWIAVAVALVIVLATAAAAVILVAGSGSKASGDGNSENPAVTQGQNPHGQNKKDGQAKAEAEAKRRAELEKQKQALLEDKDNVWKKFEDYVILGDSRAVGFECYGFLSADRVIAANGATIRSIAGHLAEIRALHPSAVYLCFGLNDMLYNFWPTPESYAAEYLEIVGNLQKELPDAAIYVSSILPAQEPGLTQKPVWQKIPAFNKALEETMTAHGIPFVSNDDIAEAHADLWEGDGLHLNCNFYPYWGVNLLMAAYENRPQEG